MFNFLKSKREIQHNNTTWADAWGSIFRLNGASGLSTVYESQALNVETVFACLHALALPMSQIDLVLMRDNQEAIDHPVYQFLKNSADVRATITAHAALLGDGIAFIDYAADGTPLQLVPINPRKTKLKIFRDGSRVYETDSPFDQSEKMQLYDFQVWHINGLRWDGVNGLSSLFAMQQALKIEIAQSEYSKNYYENGGNPGLNVSLPRDWDSQAKENYIKQFREQFSGAGNAFKVLFSADGEKVNPLSLPQRDAQFIELAKMSEEKICRVLGVPPSMVGILEKTTFNTAPEQQRAFIVQRLGYWQKQHKREAEKIVNDSSLKVRWQNEEWIEQLPAEMMDYVISGVEKAILTPNEARQKLGMSPTDDPIADRLQLAYAKANEAIEQEPADEADELGETAEPVRELPEQPVEPRIDLSPVIHDVASRVVSIEANAHSRNPKRDDEWWQKHEAKIREMISPVMIAQGRDTAAIAGIAATWIESARAADDKTDTSRADELEKLLQDHK